MGGEVVEVVTVVVMAMALALVGDDGGKVGVCHPNLARSS